MYVRKLPISQWATTSFIASLLGVIPCMFGLASLTAVICGHLALREIDAAPNRFRGRGLAVTGLILGYPVTAFWAFFAIYYVIKALFS